VVYSRHRFVSRSPIQFDEFALDCERYELLRAGRPIKLEKIPMELLILLVNRDGRLVTRQEIVEQLWGKDVFVDTEHGINTAIRKVRQVLRDNPDRPRFVQTVAGKGYRFVARIEFPIASTASTDLQCLKRGTESREAPAAIESKAQAVWSYKRWFALLGVLATLVVGLAFWFLGRLPEPRVLSFTPLTRDRVRKYLPLLTDGTRLYFMMPNQTGWTLAEVSTSGGETARVSSQLEGMWPTDISPNGSELLILDPSSSSLKDMPLYTLPVPAGLPHRVGEIFAHDASWSPTGEQIVYARGNELHVAKSDGSDSRRLVILPGPASDPRWSPDGRVLRFTLVDLKTGSSSLWEVASDGTSLHPLLPGWSSPSSECCGTWTPDGNYFVFVSRGSTLWVIREKNGFLHKRSTRPIQLTTGQSLMFSPVPSRDGKTLFAIQRAPQGELVRLDTKSQHYLPYLEGISAIQLAFSRDRQWVAYISFPDGTLWRSKVDGTERLQLTSAPLISAVPQWSPDGKQIAFAASPPGKPLHVYIVSADGGTPKEVTKGEVNEFFPSWSGDGNSLFFGNLPINIAGVPATAIYQLNLETNQLTTVNDSEGKGSPILSPDDNYIAALSDTNHLMLLDVKAQKWTELTQTAANHPTWSHDGKYVYFDSTAEGEPAYYRVKIKDHKLERVASLKDVKRPATLSLGTWTGLAPDDSPLALRDISTYEIYAMHWELP
jgi:Tol biopolymer transport system component/DNA-binding winged helix-turn-helix (wHTH) protein